MNQAEELYAIYKDLDWEVYVDLSNQLTNIDKESLAVELAQHATQYSYYKGLLAIAKDAYDVKKMEYEQDRACRGQSKRQEAALGKKKLTDKALELRTRS